MAWSARRGLGGIGACLVAALLLLGSGAAAVGADPATGADPAATSATPPLPDALTPDAARDLLARLSDAEARALLLAHLDRLVAVQPAAPEAGVLRGAGEAMAALRDRWRRILAAAPALPGVGPFLVDRLVGERSAAVLPLILLGLGLCFAVGLGAEWLFRRLTADLRRPASGGVPGGNAGGRLGYLLLRLGLDLLGLAVFALATLGAFFIVYQGHEPVRLTLLTYLGAVVAVRAVVLVSRLLLAPDAPALRTLPLGDDAARELHRWVVRLGVLWAALFPIISLLRALGLDPDLAHLLSTLAAAVAAATLITLIARARHPVAELIRGRGGAPAVADAPAPASGWGGVTAPLREAFARTWHVLAIAYVLGIWALAEVTGVLGLDRAQGAGIKSLLLLVAVPLLDAALGRAVAAYGARRRLRAGTAAADDAAAYTDVVHRGLRIVLYLLAVVVFARLWGFDLFDFAADNIGERAVSAVVDIGLILLMAYLGWQLARAALDRRIAREAGAGGGLGASRLRTLLPLVRSFLFISVVVIATMMVLSSLGVDIGPLLAGAGVVGLAIGFGAQTLVKDIVSGAFFLLDDAFRLGEYIEAGDVKGTVEKISVRSMRLRHHRGALNTVPYGEIRHLTNQSRDWVIVKLEFLVPHDTDLAKVKRIFKRIGAELQADPAVGPNLLDPLKSQGVLRVEDSGLVIRAKFMAKPGEQFVIRREVFQRVQKAFEEGGIPFARRQVAVYVPPGQAPDPEAIAEAAAAAMAGAEPKAAGAA